jgi:SAM-dependent methyltransferase
VPNPHTEVFDAWAKQGAGARMEEAHEFAGRKVLDRISIGYDESFIDLGCGSGWATRYIAAKVPTIGLCVGVDASPEFIKEARALAAGKYPVKFLAAPIEELPFGESSFDHAFSMEALYYVKDPKVALEAVRRILKVGGRFHLVVDYFKENPASAAWQKDSPLKMHFLSQAEWVALLREAGFEDVVAERILDDRPVPADLKFPWGGFKTGEDLVRFRTEIGSLYVTGRKASASSALDPFLDRARDEIRREEAGGDASVPGPTRGKRHEGKRRRGR